MDAAAPTFPLADRDAALPVARTAALRAVDESSAPPPTPPGPEAFAELIAEHQQVIYGYLRARVLEPADADDLSQEVFLRSYVGWRSLPRGGETRYWLLGIARNVLHEYARRIRRRREVAWTELCLSLDSLLTDRETSEHEALAHLPNCLESLGKSARDALEMQYHSRLKLQEIGARLKRSEGAVKLLLYRARQALRHCLDAKLQERS